MKKEKLKLFLLHCILTVFFKVNSLCTCIGVMVSELFSASAIVAFGNDNAVVAGEELFEIRHNF